MPSYASLVRDYYKLVFHIARSVLRDPAAAEDVTQDLFLDFLTRPESLAAAENLKAFVAGAAVRRALKARRGDARRANRERAVETGRGDMDPVERAFRAEVRERVEKLPVDQRVAVELHYYRGFTVAEAGQALDIPAGTVASRLGAALVALRKVLGATAFAGLLAGLESELSHCAAQDVPAGLEERLLSLKRRSSWAGRAVGAAAVVVVALLAARAIRESRESDPHAGAAGAAVAGGAAEPGENSRGLPARSARKTGTPADSEPEEVFEAGDWEILHFDGFLVRTDRGLFIEKEDLGVPFPGYGLETILHDDGSMSAGRSGRPSRVRALTAPELAAFPAAATNSFEAFLWKDGPATAAPRCRVRVEIREDQRHGDEFTDVSVLELLETETLSDAWLAAWRDLLHARLQTMDVARMDPGLNKRAAALQLAGKVSDALDRARRARAGDACVRWRVRQELDAASPAYALLSPLGIESLLPPGFPGRVEVLELLIAAKSPEALRETIVGRWGEEALLLDTPLRMPDGNGGSTWTPMPLDGLCAMKPGEFAALVRRIAADPVGMSEGVAPPEDPAARDARIARVRALGLEVDDLTSQERERFLVEVGVRVLSVAEGSAAAKAGVRTGDVIWMAKSPWREKGGGVSADADWTTLEDERFFGEVVGRVAEGGFAALEIRVVRESGVVEFAVER